MVDIWQNFCAGKAIRYMDYIDGGATDTLLKLKEHGVFEDIDLWF
jgi:hypothetical protein